MTYKSLFIGKVKYSRKLKQLNTDVAIRTVNKELTYHF